MTSLIGPNMWLEMYFRNGLRGDMDWVEVADGSFTYWQARLAQTTSVAVVSEFGDTKWRIRTRIVDDVKDPEIAKEACLALNRYAAGWSFAYNESDRAIEALAAIYAPIVPFPTESLNRISEVAWLSSWMSDVIAERLAQSVEGKPAFSHPASQDSVRTDFDAYYYYAQTLRARPEWIVDRTSDQFSSPAQIGEQLVTLLEVEADQLSVDEERFIGIELGENGMTRVCAYFG